MESVWAPTSSSSLSSLGGIPLHSSPHTGHCVTPSHEESLRVFLVSLSVTASFSAFGELCKGSACGSARAATCSHPAAGKIPFLLRLLGDLWVWRGEIRKAATKERRSCSERLVFVESCGMKARGMKPRAVEAGDFGWAGAPGALRCNRG